VQPTAAPQAVRREVKLESQPFDPSTLRKVECESTGGSKIPFWNTYDGTPGVDANLAVASGKAFETGFTYAVGFYGPDATITKFDPLGGCAGMLIFPGAVHTDIAINYDAVDGLQAIYVVGNTAAGASYVMRVDETFAFFSADFYFPLPGGTVSFEGIGLGQSGAIPDVFVTGSYADAGAPYESVVSFRYDKYLTPMWYFVYDFGVETHGLGVDADRPNNSYYAMQIDDTPISRSPMAMRLDLFGGIDWAAFIPTPPPTPYSIDNGFYGVKFIGGGMVPGPATGVYTAGIYHDDLLNPGMANLILTKWLPLTGAIDYSVVFGIPGEDYAATDVVADRDVGNAYTSGWTTTAGIPDANISVFDPFGAFVSSDFIGAPGTPFPDMGTGIDLEVPFSFANVMSVGYTETPEFFMFPPAVGCDPTYGGLGDGFVSNYFQPI
jgi:hypothetical protein